MSEVNDENRAKYLSMLFELYDINNTFFSKIHNAPSIEEAYSSTEKFVNSILRIQKQVSTQRSITLKTDN